MFFEALFKQQKQAVLELSSGEKFLVIIRELLNKELPEHLLQHHILYTANTKIESLNTLLTHHRNQCNVEFKVGQYHKEIYDLLRKQISNLQSLVDCYMELSVDVNQMDHRLLFHYDRINYLFDNYSQYKDGKFSTQTSQLFWQALKEDILEIIQKIL